MASCCVRARSCLDRRSPGLHRRRTAESPSVDGSWAASVVVGLSGRVVLRWHALSTYVRAPFLFVQEGFHVEAAGSLEWNGDRWEMLRLTFPPDEPTHCRTQVDYMDDKGLIQRLDYVAEPIGRWAHAAHFCTEYRDVGGLRVATRRWVVPRRSSGSVWRWPRLMRVQIDGVQLMC